MEQDLQQQINELRELLARHTHIGDAGGQLYVKSLFGFFETVSTAPSGVPKTTYDQIKIYVNGATYRLYWYDSVGNAWHYVTATA